ncbi:helix-turn-helix transcriptional regulator [Pseudomonas sp. CAN2814]|uniref:LexA family transcriptional regulator n=1 Tax=Pseudomonas sp. CAN1 TaxID=3046726 RepID=UPI0026473970|nr:helix-turn-helix transcriptional regulator [Pseudomonas sp. CAN1]MDN6860738.1 helix-turn-helix transcriptional regulator [Pseudomonas sp. CAN1]
MRKNGEDALSESAGDLENGKFSERLHLAIGDQSVLAFAKRCGISDSLVRKYLGGSLPGMDNLVTLATAAGVSIEWLATGEGEMRRSSGRSPRPRDEADEEYAHVPLYDARISAGHGVWSQGAEVLTHLAFTRYSLQKKGLDLSALSAVRIRGDSMEPLLTDGDAVVVDHRFQKVHDEAIYVIRLDDHLFAKRLQRQFDGSIAIISENKAYNDMVVPKDQLENLEVIGRVIWLGRWMA